MSDPVCVKVVVGGDRERDGVALEVVGHDHQVSSGGEFIGEKLVVGEFVTKHIGEVENRVLGLRGAGYICWDVGDFGDVAGGVSEMEMPAVVRMKCEAECGGDK